jgi:LysM repeat protein
MKVGSAVLGVHVAVLCVFALTQGCVTTESQGSGRGAGARLRGPWKHEHKGKAASAPDVAQGGYNEFQGVDESSPIFGGDDIHSSDMGVTPEPFVAPSNDTFSEVYIVKKGDILGQIAADFDTSVKRLVEMNGLANPDVLYVGQELRVPAGRGTSALTTKKPTSGVKRGGSYEIRKGDTLSGIALAAGVSIDDLRSLNNIKDDKIFAGQTIDIPSYGKVPSSTPKSKPKKAAPAPAPVEPAPVEEPAVAEPAPVAFAEPVVEPVVETVETTSMSVGAVIDHVVYPEETLDEIARQYSVSKAEIMRLNNISDETQVHVGQRLRVPISE